MNRRTLRKVRGNIMVGLVGAAVVLALLPLIFILLNLVLKGAGSLSLDFFTKMPAPAGETGGGVMHAIVGTLIMVGLASAMGMPIGIGAGIFCAEYPGNRIAWISRFVADVMNGTPSIVVGVFAWTWIVATQKHFSGFAGSVALAMLMIPMVMRTTEEMIKLVPNSLREAALALGYPRWRTSLSIVVRTTLPGIVTGSLLAVARVAGETAPLLFTALNNQFFSTDLNAPMANLPTVIFQFALSPYDGWQRLAWGGALLVTAAILVINIVARWLAAGSKS